MRWWWYKYYPTSIDIRYDNPVRDWWPHCAHNMAEVWHKSPPPRRMYSIKKKKKKRGHGTIFTPSSTHRGRERERQEMELSKQTDGDRTRLSHSQPSTTHTVQYRSATSRKYTKIQSASAIWCAPRATVSADCTKRRAGLRLSKHQQHHHYHHHQQQLNRKGTNKKNKNKINKKGIFLIPKVFSIQVDLFVYAGGCTVQRRRKKKGEKGNQIQIKISKLAFFIRERGKSPLPLLPLSRSTQSVPQQQQQQQQQQHQSVLQHCCTEWQKARHTEKRERKKRKSLENWDSIKKRLSCKWKMDGRTDGWTGDESGASGRWRREMASVCVCCCCILESILNEQG